MRIRHRISTPAKADKWVLECIKRQLLGVYRAEQEENTMNDRKRIYLSSPTMHGDEQQFVAEAFNTNWVAPLGPNVNHFEEEMAAYTKCEIGRAHV